MDNKEYNKDLSFVIGSFNRLVFLKICIDAIRNELETSHIRYEIIVIDGGSADGSVDWMVTQKDIISIIQHNHGSFRGQPVERRSWGYFMNLGFKAAQGKYICMLSDDSLIIPGAIINGYEYFENCLKRGEKLGALAFYFRDYPVREKYAVAVNLGNVYVNHGMYLNRAMKEAGYASEDEYFFYFADTDLTLKIKQLGYSCDISPLSYVEHYFEASPELRKKNNDSRKDHDRKTLLNKWEGIAYPREKKTEYRKRIGYWQFTDFIDRTNTIDHILKIAGIQ